METPNGTKLVKDPKRTKLQQPNTAEPANKHNAEKFKRTVKCEVLRPLCLNEGVEGMPVIYKEGQVVFLTEQEAEEFCETHFDGFYAHSGSSDKTDKHQIFKARRL